MSIAETISEKTQIETIQQKVREKIAEEKATFDTSLPPATDWEFAGQLYPRIPFPWEVLPGDIAESLQKLGRACATSPYALPGAAFCLVGSITGIALAVSPKEGWEAPLIFWHLDIRESGDGKTPPVRLMARALNEDAFRDRVEHSVGFGTLVANVRMSIQRRNLSVLNQHGAFMQGLVKPLVKGDLLKG